MTSSFENMLALRRYQDGCCMKCGRRMPSSRVHAGKTICGNCDTEPGKRPTTADPLRPVGNFDVYQDGEVDCGD